MNTEEISTFSWMLPAFSSIALTLCLILIYRISRQRDKLAQEKKAMYDFIYDVSEAFVKPDEAHIDFLLKRVLLHAQRITMSSAGAIYFLEPDGNELRARAVSGLFPPLAGGFDDGFKNAASKFHYAQRLVKEQRVMKGTGLIGEAAESGTPMLIDDAERDPRTPRFDNALFRVRSMLIVPMRFHDSVMGVLVVINRIDDAAFVDSDMTLLQALADQASVTIYFAKFSDELHKKRLLDHDLNVARKIQGALLPVDIPVFKGLGLAAYSVPAREVGGDYYDFIVVDDDHLGVLVADVSGKGVAGAIVMSICRSVFRAKSEESSSPARVLRAINNVISKDTYEDIFISMLYMVLNVKTFELKIARAGHTQPFLISSDGKHARRIKSAGIAVGLADNETFNSTLEEAKFNLAPGDIVAAYTDGLYEVQNIRSEEWGLNALENALRVHAPKGARGIVEGVREDLSDFVEDMAQHDDMTLVVIGRQKEEDADS